MRARGWLYCFTNEQYPGKKGINIRLTIKKKEKKSSFYLLIIAPLQMLPAASLCSIMAAETSKHNNAN